MSFLNTLIAPRFFRVHLVLLVILSLLCTRLPLFNYLGFEFSALIALVVAYAAGLLVFSFARGGDFRSAYSLYRISAAASLILLLPPLVIMTLNAFLVKNCSFVDGLIFYSLGPVPAVLFTTSLAVLITSLARKWRKTLFTLLFVAVLAHILVVTMTSPRIFAFNLIIGFFPGITYDESLRIERSLVLFRIITLAAAGVLIVLAELTRRFRNKDGRTELRPVELVSLVAGFAALAGTFLYNNELGLSFSEKSIRRELGGEYTTDHFTIIYPSDRIPEEKIKALAAQHEFYFFSIARQFRSMPAGKIRSFIYSSPEQKGRLIGASGTNIAKPWLWQMHINLGDIDRTLKHELVHVMAADFGFPLVRVSLNSGLIEGLATAVERVEYDETLHRLAAQIFAIGLEPDVESLFSFSGFLKSHGGTSYVLAGSFCRYLIDHYGMRRFRWLYRTGSFETFYNKELAVLIAEWRRFVEHPEPTLTEKTRAAYLFRRPSIFGKECARVIAGLNEDTRALLRRKQYASAIESSRKSLELTRTPEAVLQHATALFKAGQPQEAIRFGAENLADSTIAHVLLPLYIVMGDASWSMGNLREANRLYESLYTVHLSPAYDEACGIRLAALRGREEELRQFVLGGVDDSVRIQWLEQRLSPGRGSPLVPYLLGRELMNSGRTEEARTMLLRTGPLSVGVLEFFRLRRLGMLSFDMKEFQEAKVHFWESLNLTAKPSHRLETEEWIQRCDWTENKVKGKQ